MFKHFTLLVNKHSPINQKQFDHALKTGRASLPLLKQEFEETFIKTPSGKVALFVWDSIKSNLETPLVEIYENFVFVCSGFWHHSAYNNNQELVQALVKSPDPSSIIASLGGVFAFLILDINKEIGSIFTTVTGCPNTYHTQTNNLYAAGTSPLHLNLLADMKTLPEYDTRGFYSFIIHDYFPGELLPYKDVFYVPLNSEATFAPQHHKIQAIDTAIQNYGLGTKAATAADYDDIAQIFIDGAKKLKNLHQKFTLGLSGGKDSRLLAALFNHLSLDCQYQTYGWANHPDVILAERIAKTLKLTNHKFFIHDEQDSLTHPFDIENFFKSDLWVVNALHMNVPTIPKRYAFERSFIDRLEAQPSARSQTGDSILHLFGTAGEIIRGGFARKDACYLYGIDTVDSKNAEIIIQRILRSEILESRFKIFPDHLDKFYMEWCEDFITKNTFKDFPAALLERFFLFEHQIKRDNPTPIDQTLFLDTKLVRVVDKLRAEHRINDEPHFEVIKRLAPEIIDIPTTQNRWSFEKNGPRKGDELAYKKREPLKLEWGKTELNHTYFAASTDMRNYFETAFFDKPSFNSLYQVVDKDKLEALIYSKESYHYSIASKLLTLYASGLILSQEWLKDTQPHQPNPLLIRYDVNWSSVYYDVLDKLDSLLKKITILPVSTLSSHSPLKLTENSIQFKVPSIPKYPDFQDIESHKPIAEKWQAMCPGISIRASSSDSELGPALVLQNKSSPTQGSWAVLKIEYIDKFIDKILTISFLSRASEELQGTFYVKNKSKILFQSSFKCSNKWQNQSYTFFISSNANPNIYENSMLEFWVPLGYSTVALEVIPQELNIKDFYFDNDNKAPLEEMIMIKNYILQNYTFIEQLKMILNEVKEQFFVQGSTWDKFLQEVHITNDAANQAIFLYDVVSKKDTRQYLELNYPSLPALIRNSVYRHLKVIPAELEGHDFISNDSGKYIARCA